MRVAIVSTPSSGWWRPLLAALYQGVEWKEDESTRRPSQWCSRMPSSARLVLAARMSGEPERQRTALVRDAYSAAARDPDGEHPFAVGRELALGVGYPVDLLDRMPAAAVAAFACVAAVSVTAAMRPGDRVLDLGCGAGLDSLVTAERVLPGGDVVGIDFSAEMLER